MTKSSVSESTKERQGGDWIRCSEIYSYLQILGICLIIIGIQALAGGASHPFWRWDGGGAKWARSVVCVWPSMAIPGAWVSCVCVTQCGCTWGLGQLCVWPCVAVLVLCFFFPPRYQLWSHLFTITICRPQHKPCKYINIQRNMNLPRGQKASGRLEICTGATLQCSLNFNTLSKQPPNTGLCFYLPRVPCLHPPCGNWNYPA